MQYLDEVVAGVWADCSAAREEMGDQPASVRRAVALGRCLLEPLPVLASLCGELHSCEPSAGSVSIFQHCQQAACATPSVHLLTADASVLRYGALTPDSK